MNHASLFSGIGGFDLAAEWMGWNNVLSCEIDPFCYKVLKYHFPTAIHYEDIKTTDFTIHRGGIDILTGGFPCQPFSLAGKRRGSDDDRHLWPEMLRAVGEIQPRWIVGENVFGFTNWNGGVVFREVLSDLENEGYEVQPFIIPACAVNAPHRRDRVWIVAHSINTGSRIRVRSNGNGEAKIQRYERKQGIEFGEGCQNGTAAGTEKTERQQSGKTRSGRDGFADISITNCSNSGIKSVREWKDGIFKNESITASDKKRQSSKGRSAGLGRVGFGFNNAHNIRTTWQNFPTQPPLRSRNDGIPGGLDGITISKLRNESIKAYGNAIVPQIALQIFRAIETYETN